MAYRRYSRRRTARRRTLSNYRIATRTGAKAQARQIYALKRRINYIQRRTKPEICITRRVANEIVSSSSAQGILSGVTGRLDFLYGTVTAAQFVPQLPTPSTERDAAVGTSPANRFARLLSFKLTGNLNYNTSPETSSTPYVFRIVIVQTRATRPNPVVADDVFLDNNPVFNSLQTGLARTVKVLYDRRYYLSYQRPVHNIKITLKRLMNFYNDSTSSASSETTSESVPKGQIMVLYAYRAMISPSQATPTIIGNLSAQFEGKLAYTDA